MSYLSFEFSSLRFKMIVTPLEGSLAWHIYSIINVSMDNTFHVNNTTYGLVVTFGLKFFILFIMRWFIKQKYLKKRNWMRWFIRTKCLLCFTCSFKKVRKFRPQHTTCTRFVVLYTIMQQVNVSHVLLRK